MPGLIERRPPVKISILEKEEGEVPLCWKYCQIFSYIIVIISGISTCLAMANVTAMFHHECLLYADLSLNIENNWTIVITPHHASRWGAASHCDFTQYSPVASVMAAGLWATIFVMCGRGGASSRNLPQPWRIIPPAILFNFIFLVISCVSLALTVGGFSAFCASVAPQVNVSSCDDLLGFTWERFAEAANFYDDVILAQTGASFVVAGWMLGFLILLIRVITHADFRVIGPDRKASEVGAASTIGASTTSTILTPGRSRSRTHTTSVSSTASNPNTSPPSGSGGSGSFSTPHRREDRPLLHNNNNSSATHPSPNRPKRPSKSSPV